MSQDTENSVLNFSDHFNNAMVGMVMVDDVPFIVVQNETYQCGWPVEDAKSRTLECVDVQKREPVKMEISSEDKGLLAQRALFTSAAQLEYWAQIIEKCMAPSIEAMPPKSEPDALMISL